MLDTNICVFLIRKKTPLLLDRLEKTPPGSLILSAITLIGYEAGLCNLRGIIYP
jgi:predicted nucleic acid-binding protein